MLQVHNQTNQEACYKQAGSEPFDTVPGVEFESSSVCVRVGFARRDPGNHSEDSCMLTNSMGTPRF